MKSIKSKFHSAACRSLLLGIALLLAALPAHATWSIIITDSATGEVGIASATCVVNEDLKSLAAAVVVGKGAGSAQALPDEFGVARQIIFEGLKQGIAPDEIITLVNSAVLLTPARQYGIADTQELAAGFSGLQVLLDETFAGDLTGQVGTLTYALQGNVLTGESVLTEAEKAIHSPGWDLSTKLMTAMLAAQRQGGDGRCNCLPPLNFGYDFCGAPPNNGLFRKSAHAGYMVVTRVGDMDGTCTAEDGCANGDYYLDLNVAGEDAGDEDPDPVFQLWDQFLAFRQDQVGRPDHYESRFVLRDQTLPANGRSTTVARLVPRDLAGTPITEGGAGVSVTLDPSSEAWVSIGNVVDEGDGTYEVPLTAGTTPGIAKLIVEIDDGSGSVLLAPFPSLTLRDDYKDCPPGLVKKHNGCMPPGQAKKR